MSAARSCRTVVMDNQGTTWIKKEEADGLPDDPGLMFLEDPLKTEVPHLPIKLDPEQKLCMDSSENNVVASTCAAKTTRLIQNSGKSCGISFEETVMQKLVTNELEISAEESPHLPMFGTHTQGLEEEEEEEEEESLFGTRLKYSWEENKFHKFSCSICLKSFASKYRLIMHVFIHMDGVRSPKYICKSCGEIFWSDIGLNKHLKRNKGVKTSSADHDYKRNCIHKHQNIFLEGGEKYSLIEHTEKQSLQLLSQVLRATGTRPHKCDVCGKCFTQLGHLKTHALLHTGIRPHKCDTCGKCFTQLGHLKTHVLLHTGIRPHKCDVCGKGFTQLSHLKTHALLHTGSRTHKCDTCGKCFTQLGHLKPHALLHTGIRPHKCDICGKSFTQLSSLKTHALIHTGIRPHKCDNCGKCFTRLGDLRKHALMHAGIRPHKCDVCGKCFTKLHYLRKHALIHAGIRPHKCDVCGKCFARLCYLKTHALIHVGIKTSQM